jgi:tetratricopeptide (TPR) repeat protein
LYQIAFWALAALALSQPGLAAEDPDALYAQRATLAKAVQAAAIWQAALDRNPSDFDAAWKRARAGYWIGGHETNAAARDAAYEAAMAAARKAIAAHPDKPEGHFWLAANMGGYAQDHGIRGGLKYPRRHPRRAREGPHARQGVSAGIRRSRAGRWYFQVPGLFGGSKRKSEEHLRAALAYNPRSIVTRLFLAETLEALDRRNDAIAELRQIESLTPDPDWIPEDTEFKAQARAMLARLTQGSSTAQFPTSNSQLQRAGLAHLALRLGLAIGSWPWELGVDKASFDVAAALHPPFTSKLACRARHLELTAQPDIGARRAHLQLELAGLDSALIVHACERQHVGRDVDDDASRGSGASSTREKALSSLTGRTTDATRSRT